MENKISIKQKIKDVFKVTSIPVLLASLCCLSPLLIFALGLSTLSFATSLTDVLYGQWKWAFRGVGLLMLIVFLILHFRRKGVCTINQAVRHKNKIINMMIISLVVGVLAYLFFLYVVVHYAGVWAGVWE